MAKSLRREGEEVGLLAMFNGPSPAWIAKWSWFGNQPQHRAKRVAASTPTLPTGARILRTLRSRERRKHMMQWGAWKLKRKIQEPLEPRRARLSFALGRPLPEWLRESYFLRLHAFAERAYEATPYDGEIILFSGAGLYEDPELGWSGLAERGIRVFSVPGDHRDNREMMREQHVKFVADRLTAYLDGSLDGVDPAAAVEAAVSTH
jgi:thioesterase domain-containing protein